jgi:hypothetical protein
MMKIEVSTSRGRSDQSLAGGSFRTGGGAASIDGSPAIEVTKTVRASGGFREHNLVRNSETVSIVRAYLLRQRSALIAAEKDWLKLDRYLTLRTPVES